MVMMLCDFFVFFLAINLSCTCFVCYCISKEEIIPQSCSFVCYCITKEGIIPQSYSYNLYKRNHNAPAIPLNKDSLTKMYGYFIAFRIIFLLVGLRYPLHFDFWK